ncbi:MAG: sigma-70 family RNA polymerase sigma factor [Planctomycetota bacterium]
MPETPTTQKIQALLEQGGWVRALARSLVADPATADDVEQMAWLAAVERTDSIRNPKSWFGGVVRNLTGMHWREQKARNRREDLVGERRAGKDLHDAEHQQPDSISGRRETFRILAVAMGNLQEPYGTALYLRFFEELTMREISSRMQAPESTTKARITRGLEMLRQELHMSLGKDWRHCCLVFTAPLAKTAAAVGASTAVTFGIKAKVLVIAAAVVSIPLVVMQPWKTERPEEKIASTEAAMASNMDLTPTVLEPQEQEGVDRINQETAATLEPARPMASLRIKVIEQESGAPIPEMNLQLLSGLVENRNTVLSNQKGVTDENGIWNLAIPCGETWVRIVMPIDDDLAGFSQHQDWLLEEGDVFEHTISVPTSYAIRFKVKDPEGDPLANQRFRVSFGERGSGFRVHHTYRTNAHGEALATYFPGQLTVSFEDVPDHLYPLNAWLPLTKDHDGFVQDLTLFGRRELEFTVQDEGHRAAEGAVLEFRFPTLDIEGGRVSPKSVRSWGRERKVIKTDAEGKVLVVLPVIEGIQVTVQHPNYQPFATEIPSSNTQQTLALTSGGRVSGRILDQQDQPIVGAEVMAWATGELSWGGNMGNPPGERQWRRTTTDEQGNYLIHGLKTEGYFFLMVKAEGFAYYGKRWKDYPSGSIDLSLKPSAPLFGFALDKQGERLAKVWVEVSGEPVFGQVTPWETLSYYADTYRQLTDEDGAFSFPGLFPGNHKLKILGGMEMRKTFPTGPDPVLLVEGELDPGLILVDFEIMDADTQNPIAHAELWTFKTHRGSGLLGLGTQEADKDGHCISRLEERDMRWFHIKAEGYTPEVIWMTEFPDGLSSRKVALQPSAACTISFQASDGLPLLMGDEGKSLGAALLRGNGFILPGSCLSPFPMPGQGVGAAGHSAVRDEKTVFKNFPLAGGILRVEVGINRNEHGTFTPSAFLDFPIPGGHSTYTLTFSPVDLKALGLRD